MANDENLIPMNKRTENEQREIAKSGGIASGKARRRKRTFKTAARLILDLPVDEQTSEAMMAAGLAKEDCTRQMLMLLKCVQMAEGGDLKVLQLINTLLSDDPQTKLYAKRLQILEAAQNPPVKAIIDEWVSSIPE